MRVARDDTARFALRGRGPVAPSLSEIALVVSTSADAAEHDVRGMPRVCHCVVRRAQAGAAPRGRPEVVPICTHSGPSPRFDQQEPGVGECTSRPVPERHSPVVIRPDPSQLRLRAARLGLAGIVLLLVSPFWVDIRYWREHVTDPRFLFVLLLLAGPPILWLVAFVAGSWLRMRLEVDRRSLSVTGALGPTRTVARDRLGSIVRCGLRSRLWGTAVPKAFLLDRRGRYVLELSTAFDLPGVAAALAIPVAGSFDSPMTRTGAEARYGPIFRRESVTLVAFAVIGVAYTVGVIAFLIYVS